MGIPQTAEEAIFSDHYSHITVPWRLRIDFSGLRPIIFHKSQENEDAIQSNGQTETDVASDGNNGILMIINLLCSSIRNAQVISNYPFFFFLLSFSLINKLKLAMNH